jgi:hypothetical protein
MRVFTASRAPEVPEKRGIPCFFPVQQGKFKPRRLVRRRLHHPPASLQCQRHLTLISELCRSSAGQIRVKGDQRCSVSSGCGGILRISLYCESARSPLPHLHSILLDGFRRTESDAWLARCAVAKRLLEFRSTFSQALRALRLG